MIDETEKQINKIVEGNLDSSKITPGGYYTLYRLVRRWNELSMRKQIKLEQVLQAYYKELRKQGHSISETYKPMV